MATHSFEVPGVPNATPDMLVHIRQPKFPTFRDLWDGNDYVPIGVPLHEIPEFIRPKVEAHDGGVRFSLPGIGAFGVALGENRAEIEKLLEQGVPPEHKTAQVQDFTLKPTATGELWLAQFTIPADGEPTVSWIDELCLGAFVSKYLSIAQGRLPSPSGNDTLPKTV